VTITRHAKVESVMIEEGAFAGLLVTRMPSGLSEKIEAQCAIVATGGKSYPATGSTGDGYHFAEATGHRLAPLQPSLVSIETRPVFDGATGLNLKNVQLTLWIDGKKHSSEFGEADFTAKGLGGPIVLRLSRKIVHALAAGQKVEVTLDLKPALDPPKLEARLLRDLESSETCGHVLRALLPSQLVEVFSRTLGLTQAAPTALLKAPKRKQLINLLKELRFEVTGHGSWEEAIVTAGGVSLKDIDPRTMGSKKIENLFFAGEVMDLDANTGGYNLQIAFSTGWLAGEAAASKALEVSSLKYADPPLDK
ncbi:MAG: aminoacetone oxidase family FAD-binding enzyme, partial [Holophaga sp.]|nr:aminoacetone oxidase family FAD-binding enzyme [Holophaga sp.]